MTAPFREIKVVHRRKSGDEAAWVVEIDSSMPIRDLIPELVETLPIQGTPEDFVATTEGSIDEPVLVLEERPRRGVRGYRQAD